MLKIEGAIDIIAHKERAKNFDNAHISFKPRPFLHQRGSWTDFLAVERVVSQPEDSL